MSASSSTDLGVSPGATELEALLGTADPLWRALLASTSDRAVGVWKRLSRASGWTLLLKQKERTLVYLKPREGAFVAALVFGDRAIGMLAPAGIPAPVIERFETARKYAEGRSIEFAVATREDLELLLGLIDIKIASGKPARTIHGRNGTR
jgi:hypothetical protein